MEKATIVVVGAFWETGTNYPGPVSAGFRHRPVLEGWHCEGGDYGLHLGSEWPFGGWHIDELREMAKQAGTYHP